MSDENSNAFTNYLFSKKTYWFWLIILVCILMTISILYIKDNVSFLFLIRSALTTVIIFFLPGYSFQKMLYPKTNNKIDIQVVLSLGISVALSSIYGLILIYLNLFKLPYIALTIMGTIIMMSVAGLIRDYYIKEKQL